MIDTTSQKPLRVSTEGAPWYYIRLPYTQLEEVRRLLDSHGVRYWVSENVISLNNGPYFAIVQLGRGTDANAVQAILDSAG